MLGGNGKQPVIKGAQYFLAHAPGLVRHGSKPSRELARQPELLAQLTGYLRPYALAAAYPPNRAYLGSIYPDRLPDWERPWYNHDEPLDRWHPPEVTEPSGSGDVPQLNYRLIGALAVRSGEIDRADLTDFVQRHGMPGFAPTQGHVASAVPFLGHALAEMRADRMRRAMFLAKGSLFLGRMTQMSDGISLIVERNPATERR